MQTMGNTTGSHHDNVESSSPRRDDKSIGARNAKGEAQPGMANDNNSNRALPSPSQALPDDSCASPPRGNHSNGWQHYAFPFGMSPPSCKSHHDGPTTNNGTDDETYGDAMSWTRRYYFPMMCSPLSSTGSPGRLDRSPPSFVHAAKSPSREMRSKSGYDDAGSCFGTPRSTMTTNDEPKTNTKCHRGDNSTNLPLEKQTKIPAMEIAAQEFPEESNSFTMAQDDDDDERGNVNMSDTSSSYPLSQDATKNNHWSSVPVKQVVQPCCDRTTSLASSCRKDASIMVPREPSSLVVVKQPKKESSNAATKLAAARKWTTTKFTKKKAAMSTKTWGRENENQRPNDNQQLSRKQQWVQWTEDEDSDDDFKEVTSLLQKIQRRRLRHKKRQSAESMKTHPAMSPRDDDTDDFSDDDKDDAVKKTASSLGDGLAKEETKATTGHALSAGTQKNGQKASSKQKLKIQDAASSLDGEDKFESTVKKTSAVENPIVFEKNEGEDLRKRNRASTQDPGATGISGNPKGGVASGGVPIEGRKVSPPKHITGNNPTLAEGVGFAVKPGSNTNDRETLLERYPEYESIARQFEYPKIFNK